MVNWFIKGGFVWLVLLAACSPETRNTEKMVRLDQLREQAAIEMTDLNRAIRSSPKEAGLYKLRGRLHLGQKQFNAALEDLDEALKLQPEQGETHYLRARALRALKKTPEAQASVRQAIELRFVSADVHVLAGEINLALKEEKQALRHLNEALKLNPENGYAYYYKGLALAASGDTLQALGQLKQSIHRENQFVPGYRALARLYHSLKVYEPARHYVKEALALEPRNGQLWFLAGLTYEGLSSLDSASLSYRKAASFDPDLQQEAAYRQAHMAFGQRDYGKAIQYLLPVLEEDHSLQSVRWMLAQSYEKHGKWREALAHYQVLKDNNPTDRKANSSYWQLYQRLNMTRPVAPSIELIENKNPFSAR
ncbi:hypothetical protein BH24BAC1_BH24BAC1_39370 [soil metagenome]